MDEIIKLLQNVCGTMETISVVGIGNQDRFVGCAHAVRAAAEELKNIQAAQESAPLPPDPPQPDAADDRGVNHGR